MSDTLFLRFRESTEGDDIAWGVLSDPADGLVARGACTSVSDIVEEAGAQLDRADWQPDDVVMVLPASSTFITEVTIPARRRRQILRALPFVVEEQLADDVDDVHLVPGPIMAQQPVSVAVIDKQVLRDWVERVTVAELVADVAVPDALLVPVQPGISIHLDGNDALVRWGNAGASRVQRELLPQMVTLISEALDDRLDENEPLEIKVSYDADKPDELGLARLESELSELPDLSEQRAVEVEIEAQSSDLFERLCVQFRSGASSTFINLLQGEFQPVRRRGERPLVRFAWVAALLAIWLTTYLGINATQAMLLEREAQSLETEAIDLYRSWYPRDQRVTTLNIRDRTLAHIKTGATQAAEDQFFGLLSVLARELATHRGAQVRGITYSESAGQLTLELSADGYATVEGITDALRANGVDVEIASARQDEDRVTANLRLERG